MSLTDLQRSSLTTVARMQARGICDFPRDMWDQLTDDELRRIHTDIAAAYDTLTRHLLEGDDQ